MSMSVHQSVAPKSVEVVMPSSQSIVNEPSMFSGGLLTMQTIMSHLNKVANDMFTQMNEKSQVARDAQENANLVEGVMAKLEKPTDKLELPAGVIAYMKDNNILVNGKTIDEFMSEKGTKLDKGDLMMVKSSLETVSGRASDYNQQSQLKLQQVMQTYGTTSQLAQSLQSMIAEMTKGTASAIR